jgi:myxalamid-type polyketide synthase MxaB
LAAAAGGVGIVGMQYCAWLSTHVLGTASNPRKHLILVASGATMRASSREVSAFACGVAALRSGSFFSHVLNSLSRDFISLPLAVLSELSCFVEIGKINVWSQERSFAALSTISYAVLALDNLVAEDPKSILDGLLIISVRVDVDVVCALPLQSFDMVRQHVDAFRLLQRGSNIGKVVLRLAHAMSVVQAVGTQIITGGTGGLGLATSTWLAEQGASTLNELLLSLLAYTQ